MFHFALILSLWSPSFRLIDWQGGKCSLLTAGEIELAAGAKPGASQELDMDAGKGVRMKGCMWGLPTASGQVALSTGPAPAGLPIEKLMSDNPGVNALKAQHYTEEKKVFSNGLCTAISPPANIKDGMFMTSCGTILKGTAITVVLMSTKQKPGIDATKGLLDKALARYR